MTSTWQELKRVVPICFLLTRCFGRQLRWWPLINHMSCYFFCSQVASQAHSLSLWDFGQRDINGSLGSTCALGPVFLEFKSSGRFLLEISFHSVRSSTEPCGEAKEERMIPANWQPALNCQSPSKKEILQPQQVKQREVFLTLSSTNYRTVGKDPAVPISVLLLRADWLATRNVQAQSPLYSHCLLT